MLDNYIEDLETAIQSNCNKILVRTIDKIKEEWRYEYENNLVDVNDDVAIMWDICRDVAVNSCKFYMEVALLKYISNMPKVSIEDLNKVKTTIKINLQIHGEEIDTSFSHTCPKIEDLERLLLDIDDKIKCLSSI